MRTESAEELLIQSVSTAQAAGAGWYYCITSAELFSPARATSCAGTDAFS